MSSRIERYKKRKRILKSNQSQPFAYGAVDQEKVDELLNIEVDVEKLKSLHYSTNLTYSLDADPKEVEALISDLKASFNKERLDKLLEETQSGVLFSIAGPFGLGKILSAYDKTGGNVTTIHNANNGVYAKDADAYKRDDYTNKKNSEGKQFANAGKNSVGATFTTSKMDENSIVEDAYTGKIQKANTTSPDHIVSLSQYHKDGGFMQNTKKKSDFATDENNLAITDRSINQSMRDFDKEEWMNKETNSIKNKDKFGVDEKKLRGQVKKGKATSKKHLPSNKEKAQYYIKSSTFTGMNEGVKMGAQQAIGVLLVEFFSSSFSEIRRSFNKGLEGESLYQDIKIRLQRIGKNLALKWKDTIQGFSGGFISGFISNLITTAINLFITTGKRLVRIIREGIFSLLKALKLILFPPKGITYREVMHQAMKLIAAGGIIVAGVALEEVVEKLILGIPFFAPFAAIVTSVIVGSLTASAMALVAYLIDKMDVLGVIKVEQTKYILESLNGNIQESLKRCEDVSEEIEVLLLPA